MASTAADLRVDESVLSPRVVEVDDTPIRVLTLGLDGRIPGTSVFVLQSGAGSSLEAWDARFIRAIARLAPVVAYDRPGLGGSVFDGQDPTFDHVSSHLRDLLGVLGVAPPYILIGHSWGGPLILNYASRYPEDVVGLVYVDPSHPHQGFELPADPAARAAAQAQIDSPRLGSPDWPEWRRAEGRVALAYWSTPADQRAIPPNPDVPTSVVLGFVGNDMPATDQPSIAAFHERRVKEVRDWLRDVAQLHFVLAPHAGHFVHWDDPELVADATRQVWTWAEQRR